MPPLYPVLSYAHNVIDTGLDSAVRNDGENLLQRLRPVWRMAARAAPALLTAESPESIAALLLDTASGRGAILRGMMERESEKKPRARLVAPTTMLLSPETMDANLDERTRARVIPVKNERRCALLGASADVSARRVVIDFAPEAFCPGAQTPARVELQRSSGSSKDVEMQTTSFGSTKRITILKDVEEVLLNRLFSDTDCEDTTSRALLPELPGEIPASMMVEVANFWQTVVRGHCLTAAASPSTNKCERPIAFDRMVLRKEGRNQAAQRTVLRCTLHASAAECVCHVHGIKPVEKRFPGVRFTSSKVDFSLSMCGHALVKPFDGAPRGFCPIHRQQTPNVASLPNICCHSTSLQINCSHFTPNRERKPGLWIRDIPLVGVDVLHAQTLIACASKCVAAVGPFIGKRKRQELADACIECSSDMGERLDRVEREKVRAGRLHDPDTLLKLDMLAVDLAREGSVCQFIRRTTKDVVLAKRVSSDLEPLTGPLAQLNEHHKWLFKPPEGR